jgi:GTP cyclohydrolase II
LNGRDVGKSYANANSLLKGMVIKSVRVLKSSEASVYGARGFGGVILIKAK